MNLENLNVEELNAEEMVETTGGRVNYTRSELFSIFAVTDSALENLWCAGFGY